LTGIHLRLFAHGKKETTQRYCSPVLQNKIGLKEKRFSLDTNHY
jgi:hypothetical protein